MSTITVASLDLPTGVRIEYVEQGDPGGIPVVLLHGYTDSWRSYEEVLACLPGSLRAVALSHRGHGDSERPAGGYSVEAMAADAVGLMNELGIRRAVLVGHSMGSWIAERIAIDHPARVLGLVLEGGFGPPRHSETLSGFGEEVMALQEPVSREFIREFQLATTARPVVDEVMERVIGETSKLSAAAWKAIYEGFLEVDYTGELGSIEAPTLIAYGDQDAFATGTEQLYLAGRIPNSRVQVYEGSGHSLHWEETERFAADVSAFAYEVAGE